MGRGAAPFVCLDHTYCHCNGGLGANGKGGDGVGGMLGRESEKRCRGEPGVNCERRRSRRPEEE